MKPFLVGFAGPAGAGKNLAAEYLLATHYQYAFARPLKRMLEAVGWPEPRNRAEKESSLPGLSFSWRKAAQTLGTEWGRGLDENLWLRLAQKEWAAREGQRFMVITDVRFPCEADWVRGNGLVVHVYGRATTAEGDAALHASEQALEERAGDRRLDNSGSERALFTQVVLLRKHLEFCRAKLSGEAFEKN